MLSVLSLTETITHRWYKVSYILCFLAQVERNVVQIGKPWTKMASLFRRVGRKKNLFSYALQL